MMDVVFVKLMPNSNAPAVLLLATEYVEMQSMNHNKVNNAMTEISIIKMAAPQDAKKSQVGIVQIN